MSETLTFEQAFQVSLGRYAEPEPPTRAIWARDRAAQIDWAEEQSRLWQRDPDGPVQWPAGPYSRPCPPMTAPPPFSPEERHDPRNRHG